MNVLSQLFGLPLDEFNEMDFRFGAEHPVWIAVVAVLLVPAALRFFWTSLSRIASRPRKLILFAFRIAVFIILLLVLFRPELEFRKVQTTKNTVAVVLDDSKSMTIKTFPQDRPRRDLVRSALGDNRDFLDGLGKDFQVDYYFASEQAAPVARSDIDARYLPKGDNTDLARALQEVKNRYQDKPLSAIMLFSDGADLAEDQDEVSREMKRALALLGTPVHTFQAGTNENFKDLGIERLEGSDFGFVFQPVKLTAHIHASAIGNKTIPVVVKEGGKVLLSKSLAITSDTTHYQAVLEFTPKGLGKKVYEISVPVFAGESIESNNRREFQVKIVRDRVRILHLNGRPSWDSRFLREVLINNPKVDLLSFFILRTLADDVGATTAELSLIPFPSNLLLSDYLGSFDLVIFHNFKFAPFIEKKYLENIRKYVQDGGAFIMIGGDLAFQSGGYFHTPVEDILPVRLSNPNGGYGHGDYKPEIGANLLNHPILRLEKNPEALKAAWGGLPGLNGFNEGLEPAKDAQALMIRGKAQPILAVRKYGRGRTLALATDSSWQWNFLRVGQGGSGRHYQAFWNNVIAWMTGHPETDTLKVETDKELYRENEKVLVKIKTLGEDYNPAPAQKVELVLESISHKKPPETHPLETDKDGNALLEFMPPEEGYYSATVKLSGKGKDESREARFGVFALTGEFEKPLINSNLLQTISRVTGGVYRVLDDKAVFSDLKLPNPEVRVKTKSHSVTLWDNWWSYGLLTAILFFDWWLRRKSGLS